MQTALQREATRRRLGDLIRERHGELKPSTVGIVAARARVHYTSLARYLLYPTATRTGALRRRTFEAVAMALDTNPQWLRDGQGSQQLGVWPILTPAPAECVAANPDEQIVLVLQQIQALRPPLRLRAYRAAIAAAIEVVTSEGESLGAEAYRCLMRLDALRRSPLDRAVS
jgi:hypothetical protein